MTLEKNKKYNDYAMLSEVDESKECPICGTSFANEYLLVEHSQSCGVTTAPTAATVIIPGLLFYFSGLISVYGKYASLIPKKM